MQNSKAKSQNLAMFFFLLPFYLCLSACSIPSLERPECAAGRDVVKRFYSFHFGSEMSSSPENWKAREQFLTSNLFKVLSGSGEAKKDYFTATEDYPKAFRVGECMVASADRATLQVILMWRDDNRSEQKEVRVETVQTGGKWLIDKVSNK